VPGRGSGIRPVPVINIDPAKYPHQARATTPIESQADDGSAQVIGG